MLTTKSTFNSPISPFIRENPATTELSFSSEESQSAASLSGISSHKSFAEVYDRLQAGVLQSHSVLFSSTEAQLLLRLIDDLIQEEVNSYLLNTEDSSFDESDERAFVNIAETILFADDDPADSIYDTL